MFEPLLLSLATQFSIHILCVLLTPKRQGPKDLVDGTVFRSADPSDPVAAS
jgi:hypothetical protein